MIAVYVLVGLLILSSLLGLFWQRSNQRAKTVELEKNPLLPLITEQGSEATFVQISGPNCSTCNQVKRLLTEVTEADSLAYQELEITDYPELAEELGIKRIPTVYLVDANGKLATSFSGATRRDSFEKALLEIKQ